MPRTAVVILCYNNKRFLEKFLAGVCLHSANAEIVIVDNASTDGTAAYIKSYFPLLTLIEHPQNLGFCEGYNQALHQIKADYYVLLNSDVEVTAGWLEPMVELLQTQHSVAACQPIIRSYHEPDKFEYAGAAGGFIDSLGFPFCRGRIFDTLEQDNGQYATNRPVFWATGACLLIRADVYHTLGGLESSFFAHMEEIDLCWRIQRAGLQVAVCAESSVYHVGGGTLQQDSPRKTFLNFRNGLTLLIRNLPLLSLILILPSRLVLDWLAAFQFLIKGKADNATAILKAHWYLLKNLAEISALRKKCDLAGPREWPLKQVYRSSIVFDYFVLNKHKFSELNIPDRTFLATEMMAEIENKGKT